MQASVVTGRWAGFRFIEGDIRQLADCQAACTGAQIVLHHVALGSVPRLIADPVTANAANVFQNLLVPARDAGVQPLVYAASSRTRTAHVQRWS
ncbi:MAG: hypothetical protein HEQ37_17515 [Acidovorax sp.]|nr:hypothetical protein [Acidovorax sp.]